MDIVTTQQTPSLSDVGPNSGRSRCGVRKSKFLEQFKKYCNRRYVAARAVALGFKLGLYAFIQALRLKPNRTNPRRFQINGHSIF